jgi:hypothetical protein
MSYAARRPKAQVRRITYPATASIANALSCRPRNPPRRHRLGDVADRPAPVMREDDASLIALVREAPEELGDRFGAVWAEGRELALDEAKTLARVADRHGLK